MSNYENKNENQDNLNSKKMSMEELNEVSGGGVYRSLCNTCKKAALWVLDLIKKK